MRLVFDLVLLMASGAATVYCFVLSRRLSRLNDTKSGLGASIASMSQALDQTQQTLNFARASSIDVIQKLTSAIEEADRVRPEIGKLTDELSALAELAVDDIGYARDTALEQIQKRLASGRRPAATSASGAVGRELQPAPAKRVA